MMSRLPSAACVLFWVGSLTAQNCPPEAQTAPAVKVPIRRVIFKNAQLLPEEKRQEIARAVHDDTFSFDAAEGGSISRLADASAERVRGAYQDQGYFEVQVVAKAVPVVADAGRYDIVIQAQEAGQQYRLADLNIVHATVFSEPQLRDVFSIQRGEIFSRVRIAEGLQALRRLYGSQGYINFTALPNTELDSDNTTADLTVDVDEGRQFRVRRVDVLGLDPEAKSRVLRELALQAGDVYTPDAWVRSVRMFPDAATDDPTVGQNRIDEQNGWVDIVFDFRKTDKCPVAIPAEARP